MLKILVTSFFIVMAASVAAFDGSENCYASHPKTRGDTSNNAYVLWSIDLFAIATEIDPHFVAKLIKNEEQIYIFGVFISTICLSEKSDSIEDIVTQVIDTMR